MAARDVAPLLNGDKLRFARARCAATCFGGFRCAQSGGERLPAGVWCAQFFLWAYAPAVGVVLTVLVDLGVLALAPHYYVAALIGGAFLLPLLVGQAYARFWRRRSMHRVGPTELFPIGDEFELETCCSRTTAPVIVPLMSAGGVVLRVLLTALLGAAAAFALVPSRLGTLYGTGMYQHYVVCALGWSAVTLAAYSCAVAAPASLNQYTSSDRGEMSGVYRAFYLVALFAIQFFSVDLGFSWLATYAYGCILTAITLPLWWIFGLLPTPDVLVLYVLEQCTVALFGGSPLAGVARIFGAFALGSLSVAAVVLSFIYAGETVAFYVAAGLGVLLACNILPQRQPKIMPAHRRHPLAMASRVLHTLLLIALPVPLVYVMINILSTLPSYSTLGKLIAPCISAGAWLLARVAQHLQRPLVFFVCRNRCGISGLRFLAGLHGAMVHTGSLAVVATVVLHFYPSIASASHLLLLSIEMLLLQRSMRVAWQWPLRAAFAHGLFGILRYFNVHTLIAPSAALSMSASTANADLPTALYYLLFNSPPFQAFVIGLATERLSTLLAQVHFASLLCGTVFCHRKQRPRVGALIVSILWTPFSLLAVVVASMLQAPVVPLFSLPLFIIGFPRPRYHWPRAGASVANAQDACFYQQMLPAVFETQLSKQLGSGRFGDVAPGTFYLLRHQELLAWVQVLERGLNYCIVEVRALERKMTSCHTAEAVQLDELFDDALPLPTSVSGSFHVKAARTCNRFLAHMAQPVASTFASTYSVSDMSLAGVITSHDVLRLIPNTFLRALIYEFALFQRDQSVPDAWLSPPLSDEDYDDLVSRFPLKWYWHCAQHVVHGAGADDAPTFSDEAVNRLIADDATVLTALYAFAVFEVWGLLGRTPIEAGPEHVYTTFAGTVPISANSSYLRERPDLLALTLRAYRTAVKVVLDQELTGPIESHEELLDVFHNARETWFIGVEAQAEWGDAVRAGRFNMFTLRRSDKLDYRAGVYTLQPSVIRWATVNGESVRAQWAALAIELYYFTNDDEERYSIQAHQQLLRNLVVQGASPPLGYPVLTSGAVLVPIEFPLRAPFRASS